jgi:hypothetical protein
MGSTEKVQAKGIIAMASVQKLTDQKMKEIMRNLIRKVRISVPYTANENTTENIKVGSKLHLQRIYTNL